MYWLRYLLKEPYHALRTASGREFVRLLSKYGDQPRHKTLQVAFSGYKLEVPDAMSFLWQHKEIFVDDFYFFESSNPKPVILDCGANVGMSVIYFKKLFPAAQVIAFEAKPTIASILQNNLSRNNIQNVEVVDKAVWVDEGGIWFGSEASDSSSMYATAEKRQIPSIRLKDYLARHDQIDFLKIDIEGAETEVLDDCRFALGHVKNLFVEFHSYIDHPQKLAQVMEIFEGSGFRYFVDTNQHRLKPFVNHRYKGNDVMDLQLNIFGWRE